MPADPDDVPSPIDLRQATDAHQWAREADAKRPWRVQFRDAIAETLNTAMPPVRRVLELGSGPGLLAERILRSCAIDSYMLFDFSQPMLDLSREWVGHHRSATFVLGDFKQYGWVERLVSPFDTVVAMQAIHEIRHKRHVPALYSQIRNLLRPGGLLLVCDHTPPDESARMIALHSTEAEQHAAFTSAGFVHVKTLLRNNGLYLCGGHRPATP